MDSSRVRQVAGKARARAKHRLDRVDAGTSAFFTRYGRTLALSIAAFVLLVFILRWLTPMLVGAQEPRHELIDSTDRATPSLVVLTHGLTQGFRDLRPIAAAIRNDEGTYRGADILLYAYDVRVFSNFAPEDAASEMRDVIKAQFRRRAAAGTPYKNVVLAGHSVGGLVARQAYLYGLGEPQSGDYSRRPPDEWARAVRRIVLLATPNRGVDIQRRGYLWRGLNAVAGFLGFGELIQSTYRGAPFVVNLRLAWIDTFHDDFFAQNALVPPVIVQVLGTRDGLVTKDDSVDLAQMPRFARINVPGATHNEIADMSRRYSRTKFLEALETAEITGIDREPETQPGRVVFLIHGIRDYGDWLSHLEETLKERDRTVSVETDSIGYFTISNFLNPIERERKVKWFADQYAEVRARYHHAPIAFAGHSFGTHILGEALERYRRIRIDRAYLAGSVLPRTYDWETAIRARQVGMIRNDIAEGDLPVGMLARFLSQFFDCGSAGVNGFTQSIPGRLEQNRYFRGGHAAALFNENFGSIASFLTTAQPEPLRAYRSRMPAAYAARMRDRRGAMWEMLTNFAIPIGWLTLLVAAAVPALLAVRQRWHPAIIVLGLYLLIYLYF
jgi:pimeloyl-ACP methyl ester carboxylesterase